MKNIKEYMYSSLSIYTHTHIHTYTTRKNTHT